MREGDVIINIDEKIVVKFMGWIAGGVSSYSVQYDDSIGIFKGTTEELLLHVAKRVEIHNKKCLDIGGTLI